MQAALPDNGHDTEYPGAVVHRAPPSTHDEVLSDGMGEQPSFSNKTENTRIHDVHP